ncbi:MAG: protein kinase [Pyrinomonadaceae bacterium]
MALTSGSKLGRYEVRSLIGAGGMGEVYLARDPKIGRDVAIKVLPADLSTDKERLARFEQEAQAAGSLNHPNILAIYDVQTDDGAPYVVSELLEGETLRDAAGGTPLPLRKALGFGLQVAHGLAAAHEKGIIHRDIKPENLFITSDGRVKILDFGLAKLTESSTNGLNTNLPTRKVNTDAGAVMGTVGYMSPEQLRGKPVDQRSDIFSFGTVLYEMLSGQKAFQKDSTADTISAILREDPPILSETNKSVDAGLERIVRRCLEKNREERFHSASDLAFAIEALTGVQRTGETAITTSYAESVPGRSASSLKGWLGWAVAGGLLLLLSAFLIFSNWGGNEPEVAVRFSVIPPEKAVFGESAAISPDGRRIAFTVIGQTGESTMWIRPLDSVESRMLAGTEGAMFPFWSPDNKYIGYFAQGKLKKIDASGGPSQTLADASADPRGGTWAPDGTIIYTATVSTPLMKISANGGQPTELTQLDASREQISHRWPAMLPDGRRFIFFARGKKDFEGLFVGSLDSPEVKFLISTNLRGEFAPTDGGKGMLLFGRERTLMAQSFDPGSGELSGDSVAIAQDLLTFPTEIGPTAYASFSTSPTGHLIYRTGGEQATELTWFDRTGKPQGKLSGLGIHHEPQLSRDGKKLLFGREDSGSSDIWLLDVDRVTPMRLTFDARADATPAWSPDGSFFIFASGRTGIYQIYKKPSNGSGSDELVYESPGNSFPDDISPDGRYIIVEQDGGPKTKFDLWLVPTFGDQKPFPFLATDFQETHSRIAPNGRWVAYVSDETGRPQVYVSTFPQTGGKWQVSTGGGDQPTWRADGGELYYIAPDRNLMAVAISPAESFQPGMPQALFTTRMPLSNLTDDKNSYYPAPDGKRFVIANIADDSSSNPITVVLNWTAGTPKAKS